MARATYPDRPLSGSVGVPDDAQSPAVKRVSWAAIFAGVVVAIAVQMLLALLGAGIGFDMLEPATGGTPEGSAFGIGAGLWWLVSNLIALVAGGYTAAWLAGNTLRFDGMLHGVVTWGVTLLLTFYLLTTALGTLIGGAFSMVGSVASTAASAAGQGIQAAAPQVAANVSPEQIMDRARALLRPSGDPALLSPEDAQAEIARLLPQMIGDGQPAQQAQDRVVDIMAAQLRIPRDEAQRRLDELQAQVRETRDAAVQTATSAAEETASGASTASYLAFAALLLGAIAAAAGGSMGAQRRDVYAERLVRA
ncbi:MAG: hypothetical protein U1E14_14420 [Geminicoccaceae bacterium]